MPDCFSKIQRSRVMAAVKARNTRPELTVRKLLHRLGYRFRLHRRDLPGSPDIVLPRFHKIINVHGCFWHMHHCRHGSIAPVQRADYWTAKRRRNVERDRRNDAKLRRRGWSVLTVWECQLRDPEKLQRRIRRFLEKRDAKAMIHPHTLSPRDPKTSPAPASERR